MIIINNNVDLSIRVKYCTFVRKCCRDLTKLNVYIK